MDADSGSAAHPSIGPRARWGGDQYGSPHARSWVAVVGLRVQDELGNAIEKRRAAPNVDTLVRAVVAAVVQMCNTRRSLRGRARRARTASRSAC
jgi:hypothetical protein